MKKNWKNGCVSIWMSVIIFLFVLGGPTELTAQNRSIVFEKATWQKQLKKAQKEKKLIFLDCQTKWCGFCRILEKYIFTVDSVADFYNQNFINVSMDMEEGVGIELRKKFGLNAYPTLLFVDSSGEMVDCHVGYVTCGELLQYGERAMKPEHNLAGLQKRYAAGERAPRMLREYFRILSKANGEKLIGKIMLDDLATLGDEQFYSPEVWEIMKENTQAAIPLLMERVVPGREGFDKIVGKEGVNTLLDEAFSQKTLNMLMESTRKNFNQAKCEEIKAFLLGQDSLPHVAEYIAAVYVTQHLNKGEYAQVLPVLKEALKYNFFRPESRDSFLNYALRTIAGCEDRVVRKEGADLLDALRPGSVREEKKPMYDATRNMLLGIDKN